MDQQTDRRGRRETPAKSGELSPYRRFEREEWAHLRADTPLTLDEADLERLRGLNDPVSLEEVVKIYLPLSRLLSLYVEAIQGLFRVTNNFLGGEGAKVPFIIGIDIIWGIIGCMFMAGVISGAPGAAWRCEFR